MHHIIKTIVNYQWLPWFNYFIKYCIEQKKFLRDILNRNNVWLFLLFCTFCDSHPRSLVKLLIIKLKLQRNIVIFWLKLLFKQHVWMVFHISNIHIDFLIIWSNPLLYCRKIHLQKSFYLRWLYLPHSSQLLLQIVHILLTLEWFEFLLACIRYTLVKKLVKIELIFS